MGKVNKIRSNIRKLESFAINIPGGIVNSFIIPTSKRWQEENGSNGGSYSMLGSLTGMFGSIFAQAYLSTKMEDEYSLLVFAPIVVTNLLSEGYELIRNRLR